MKRLKKMMALIIAVAMVLSMGAMTVFADSDYSITVENTNTSMTIVGKEYKAYKVFDLTLGAEDTTTNPATYGAYAYSIKSSDWAFATLTEGATTNSTTGVITTTYGITLTPSAADPNSYSVDGTGMTDANTRALADALKAVLPTTADGSGTGAKDGSTEKAVIELDKAGWYAVYGTVKPTDPLASEDVVAAVGLTTTDKKVTVNPKASVPTLDKSITGVTEDGEVLDADGQAAVAKVGAKVSYQLDSVTPDLTGYDDYTFIISDTISSGLTYDNTSLSSLVVKIGGNVLPATTTPAGGTPVTNYTLAVDGQSFTLTIPFDTLNSYSAGTPIVVTYDAIVNSGALTTDYENNTASLEYSHSPYDDTTNHTPDKKTYVIDLNLDVDKIAEGKSTTKLSGATFKLYKTAPGAATYAEATEYAAGTTYYSDNDGTDTEVAIADADAFAAYDGTLYTKTVGEDSKLYYKWSSNKVTWVEGQANGDPFVTNAQGKLTTQVRGLDQGTYYLEETVAPEGYNPLSAPVEVIISATEEDNKVTYAATYGGAAATMTNGQVDLTAAQNSNQPVATGVIENNAGTVLPSTGGIGTTIFYVVGAILVIGAGVVLITRRRMDA